MSLIYETLPSISTTLLITSAMTYSVQLSSSKILTTLQGLIGAAYNGLGQGIGTFLGGFIVNWLSSDGLLNNTYGTRASFRVLGVTAAGTAVVYLLFNLLYIRNKKRQKIIHISPVELLDLAVAVENNAAQSDEEDSSGF